MWASSWEFEQDSLGTAALDTVIDSIERIYLACQSTVPCGRLVVGNAAEMGLGFQSSLLDDRRQRSKSLFLMLHRRIEQFPGQTQPPVMFWYVRLIWTTVQSVWKKVMDVPDTQDSIYQHRHPRARRWSLLVLSELGTELDRTDDCLSKTLRCRLASCPRIAQGLLPNTEIDNPDVRSFGF